MVMMTADFVIRPGWIMNLAECELQISFDEAFGQYRDKPLGIYGLGNNARTLLSVIRGYDFACVIAADHNHEDFCGRMVLPIEEAVRSVSAIIIAAIPSSCAIVFRRIKDLVPPDIPIYDMHGYLLSGDDQYRENPYWAVTVQDLYDAIDAHDVISFDIYDTIVMRRVLEPRDIFDIAYAASSKHFQSSRGASYKAMRIRSEEELYSEQISPTIDDIYIRMREEYGLSIEEADALREAEILTEFLETVPRKAVADAFEYAHAHGKKIILTSDMYLSSADIKRILSGTGIDTQGIIDEIIVSCEYKATKYEGTLYDILKEKIKSHTILHIGDNLHSDISKAKEAGLDVFYIKKGYDLLAESSCGYILDKIDNRADKRLAGYMVSELFNDPFIINQNRGKLFIRDYRTLALYLLPITLVFLSYIMKCAQKYDHLCFPSRDGYFLYKMYEKYRIHHPESELPPAVYFYASRQAVSRAAILSYEDIITLSNKIVDDPKLNLRTFFRNQFDVELTDQFDMTNGEAIEKWGLAGLYDELQACYDEILQRSEAKRKIYKRYLESINDMLYTHPDIKHSVDSLTDQSMNEKYSEGEVHWAVVDVVTQGTLVYGLSRITGFTPELIAMGTSCVPNRYIEDESRVNSLYGNISERVNGTIHSMSDFSELHLLLEMLYASDEDQFLGFTLSHELIPQFVKGTAYNKELLSGVQTELEELLSRFWDTDVFGNVSKSFALNVLRMCFGKYSDFSDELKSSFMFDDPYDGSLKKCNLIEYLRKD